MGPTLLGVILKLNGQRVLAVVDQVMLVSSVELPVILSEIALKIAEEEEEEEGVMIEGMIVGMTEGMTEDMIGTIAEGMTEDMTEDMTVIDMMNVKGENVATRIVHTIGVMKGIVMIAPQSVNVSVMKGTKGMRTEEVTGMMSVEATGMTEVAWIATAMTPILGGLDVIVPPTHPVKTFELAL